MVMAQITVFPSEFDKEVTCEASNQALSEPIRNTVVIELNTTIVETSSATEDADMISYEYEYDENEYANELVYEIKDLELNVTDIDHYRLSADGIIDPAMTENKLYEDSANKGDDADTVTGNDVDSSFKEMEAHLIPIGEHDKEAAAT